MSNSKSSEFLSVLNNLNCDKSAEYAWDVFADWAVANWFWFALDGGGGVGKTEAEKQFKKAGVLGLSAGDYFRGANLVLTDLGLTEKNEDQIRRELPNIKVTTRKIDEAKRVAIQYKREEKKFFDPDGSGENGLRNPVLRRVLTDFLSAYPVAVQWWKRQVRITLAHAARKKEPTPVITVGRTYRKIRQNKSELRYWEKHLEKSVFGYIYANKQVLAERSTGRAIKEYPSRPAEYKEMSLEEFVRFSVQSDWERTVGEMTRKEEQLARPAQAATLKEKGVYDFSLNTSHQSIIKANALYGAAIMSTLSKENEQGQVYQVFYEILLQKYQVPEVDPEIPAIEDDIDTTYQDLIQKGKLEAV